MNNNERRRPCPISKTNPKHRRCAVCGYANRRFARFLVNPDAPIGRICSRCVDEDGFGVWQGEIVWGTAEDWRAAGRAA